MDDFFNLDTLEFGDDKKEMKSGEVKIMVFSGQFKDAPSLTLFEIPSSDLEFEKTSDLILHQILQPLPKDN